VCSSETEHDTDTETETDATMSESNNITDTNTDTDGQVTAHNSTDNNEPTIIELETETMVIELSCVVSVILSISDIVASVSVSVSVLCSVSEIAVSVSVLSVDDSLTKNTKTKLTVLSKGDNVIIPIPSVDRGPADERNIRGVVMNINEHGDYKIGNNSQKVPSYEDFCKKVSWRYQLH
jgi:hypothetical protein